MANPLVPPLTTAAVIAELRLDQADVSPAARRAAARAAAAFMTVEERIAVAERNSAMFAHARHLVKLSNSMMAKSGR